MSELLEISKKLSAAANRWPLSKGRRLDLLRVAKRIRLDMTDQEIELEMYSAAATGCRTIGDFAAETGLSKKETADVLDRMWKAGTMERAEESIHDRGRPRLVFILAGELNSMENNSFEDEV